MSSIWLSVLFWAARAILTTFIFRFFFSHFFSPNFFLYIQKNFSYFHFFMYFWMFHATPSGWSKVRHNPTKHSSLWLRTDWEKIWNLFFKLRTIAQKLYQLFELKWPKHAPMMVHQNASDKLATLVDAVCISASVDATLEHSVTVDFAST